MLSLPEASVAVPALDRALVDRWRRGWDEVMAGFLPSVHSCETAMLAVAEAVCGPAPARVLDLGGGPGVFAERMATRWRGADVALLDLDPVLLALAAAGTGGRLALHRGDLAAGWHAGVATAGSYDVITAVMTIHYLDQGQARELYRTARTLLRPGGLFIVADLMPEPGLTGVMGRLHPAADDAAAGLAWTRWWEQLRSHAALKPLMDQRAEIFGKRAPAEFTAPVDWHADVCRDAGFEEAGVVWRWGAHAALAAVA
ncbi:class I SAM-dependent methyltransferase [Actinoplanes sp. G11-F43]|uniref:class I SAM-dependent methyltransferase n=1 Tax=Actinoplanes sp. G11-F43 TaxID=3424130 RepID=UPI003D32C446